MSREIRARLLIVDDEEDTRKLLRMALVRSGYSVSEAASGKAALEITGRERFNLILLDVMMPDMDGFVVCKTLKANAETRDVPVIFFSAIPTPNIAQQIQDAGGIAHILKPFQLMEVIDMVERVLTKSNTTVN